MCPSMRCRGSTAEKMPPVRFIGSADRFVWYIGYRYKKVKQGYEHSSPLLFNFYLTPVEPKPPRFISDNSVTSTKPTDD